MQFNVDNPFYLDEAITFPCHELYPGHHLSHLYIDKYLFEENGWVEYSVVPCFSPFTGMLEGTPADVARLYPEAKIVAINGKAYSSERLERAIENSPKAESIELLVVHDETYSVFEVNYDGGAWYHKLSPTNGESDYLTDIAAPRVERRSESK